MTGPHSVLPPRARRRPRRLSSGRQAGFASVLVLFLATVVVLVASVVVALGAVAVSRHRAASAADLGALAAADRTPQGAQVACAAATRVVTAVGGRLTTCRLSGSDAEVEVAVRPPGPLGTFGTARARARAGPARARSP